MTEKLFTGTLNNNKTKQTQLTFLQQIACFGVYIRKKNIRMGTTVFKFIILGG